MPKVQYINPDDVRKSSQLEFKPIPVNQYNKTVEEEKKNFSNKDLVRIYHDMVVIREFETMLNLIKTQGKYSGKTPFNPWNYAVIFGKLKFYQKCKPP